jgi:hypothetical protein
VGAKAGNRIFLDLPETGAAGEAFVEAVLPCPPLHKGVGNIVTGVFAHEADPDAIILIVTFENGSRVQGVTKNHPFFSVDRKHFVEIGEMRVSERVKVDRGITRIKGIESRFAERGEILYNLEVQNHHVYQVTTSGILVHNTCPGTDLQFGRKYGRHKKDYPDLDHREYRALADRIHDDPILPRHEYPADSARFPGETHIVSGEDLLRLDGDGNFISMYPGATSTYPNGFPPPPEAD